MTHVRGWKPTLAGMMLPATLAAMLASCGSVPDRSMMAAEQLNVAPAPADMKQEAPEGGAGQSSAIPLSQPQLAYSYRYGFRLPSDRVAETQKAHAAACEKLGPTRCRVISLSQSGDENRHYGELKLSVEAKRARSFAADLGGIVSGKGGEQIDAGMTAEDLSKQIVDTDARIRAKTLLAERLTQLLATRGGSVADLVAAERALSQVQEELDQARTWLAEMKGRVAMSDMTITYSSTPTASSSLLSPVREAVSSAGEILGFSVGALIRFLVAALPWLLVLWGAVKLYRKLGGRWPRWKWRRGAPVPTAEAQPPA